MRQLKSSPAFLEPHNYNKQLLETDIVYLKRFDRTLYLLDPTTPVEKEAKYTFLTVSSHMFSSSSSESLRKFARAQ